MSVSSGCWFVMKRPTFMRDFSQLYDERRGRLCRFPPLLAHRTMVSANGKRAILAVDVAGYNRLMGRGEDCGKLGAPASTEKRFQHDQASTRGVRSFSFVR